MNICSRVRLVVVLGLASAATAAGAAAGPSVAAAHCAPVAPPVCMLPKTLIRRSKLACVAGAGPGALPYVDSPGTSTCTRTWR